MKHFILAAGLVVALISSTFVSAAAPTTQADIFAETPAQHDARMQWWRDARFGMFIHFGLYAIPAGQWNGKQIKGAGEWIMHEAKIPPDEYAPLAKQFNPTKFDAAKWAAIAKDAGMKYIVITTKHHEGFSLFATRYSDYNVMNTPFKRDIMKELSDATRAAGLHIGWYHSILDWHDPNQQKDETFPIYEQRLRNQVSELLTNYGPIGVMWFDGEWIKQWNDQRGEDLYKLCRTLQPSVIVNNRVGKQRAGMNGFTKTGGFSGDYATPEQTIPAVVPPGTDWETCMTMNDTWGYKKEDLNFKSTRTLIRDLIDIASKGGNFLLNVGPTAEGEIPPQSVERLHAIGEWMRINGEAIYGTTAGPFPPLPWGRVTAKEGTLYLHIFDWPKNGRLIVPTRTMPVLAYPLADPSHSLMFHLNPEGFAIDVGKSRGDADATVIVLKMPSGPIDVVKPPAKATTHPTTKPAAGK